MKEFAELTKILETEDVRTFFQPIVNLSSGEVLGYEALSRGPEDSFLQGPLDLLRAAEKNGLLWEMELLFRKKSIERSRTIDKDKFLFINVDPNIIKDEKFHKGFTREFLAGYGISPQSIIFEITERTAIEDYKGFRSILNNYKQQGYKIAIDDAGSGYSGMKTITETQPNYIKIDMALVRDINKDHFKQAMMRTFVKLGEATGIRLIAEGIETKQELQTLIQLGVYAGQGYFIQRPAGTFLEIPDRVRSLIRKYDRLKGNSLLPEGHRNSIGQLAQKQMSFDSETPVWEILDHFQSSGTEGVCIVDNGRPVGLVMKHTLHAKLATQYGVAVYSKRPVRLVMDPNPLVVDCHDVVTTVSEMAMDRSGEGLYNLIIVTEGLSYYGMVSIQDLLKYTTALEKSYARELNPLTFLPGNKIINRILETGIRNKRTCTLLYLDLDNFKAYNDTYGFENGDKILKMTSDLIKDKTTEIFLEDHFIGHIGGDDFVCVTDAPPRSVEVFCRAITESFDQKILNYFNERDRMNGWIECEGSRSGRMPLTSLSIAGFQGSLDRFDSPDDLGKHMSFLKRKVKSVPGSHFILFRDMPAQQKSLPGAV